MHPLPNSYHPLLIMTMHSGQPLTTVYDTVQQSTSLVDLIPNILPGHTV